METNCKFCGISFEAKRSTAVFCSTNHKVRFNGLSDEEKKEKEKNVEKKEILPPQPLSKNDIKLQNVLANTEINVFCNANNCTPADLIEAYKNRNKFDKIKKIITEKYEANDNIGANRAMKEPEKGSNAYFLRYGKYE